MAYPDIRLGLCCHNLDLKYNHGVFTGRTIRMDTIKKFGLKYLIEVANKNLDDLYRLIGWCPPHGIYVYRISSDIIPHGSNPELLDIPGGDKYMTLSYFKDKLKKVGDLANKLGVRVTFHPGQYNQVGTPNPTVFEKTRLDLLMHAKFLDYMNAPEDSIIIVHGGGTYGDKPATLVRWEEQFKKLPEPVRRRLVLENDEKGYSVDDLMPMCKRIGIPVLFDIFHYYCYEKKFGKDAQRPIDEILPEIFKQWGTKRPKFHVSEQGQGCLGAHSTIVKSIPEIMMGIPKKYNKQIDIMIEAKGKEVAVAHLYKTYPALKPKGAKDLPDRIPRKAQKDIKIDDPSILSDQ